VISLSSGFSTANYTPINVNGRLICGGKTSPKFVLHSCNTLQTRQSENADFALSYSIAARCTMQSDHLPSAQVNQDRSARAHWTAD